MTTVWNNRRESREPSETSQRRDRQTRWSAGRDLSPAVRPVGQSAGNQRRAGGENEKNALQNKISHCVQNEQVNMSIINHRNKETSNIPNLCCTSAMPKKMMEGLEKGIALKRWGDSNSTSGNMSEETQKTNLNEHEHRYAHYSVIYNRQYLETAQVSISRWVDKKALVHIYSGISLGLKKEWSVAFATVWIDQRVLCSVKLVSQRKTNTI